MHLKSITVLALILTSFKEKKIHQTKLFHDSQEIFETSVTTFNFIVEVVVNKLGFKTQYF